MSIFFDERLEREESLSDLKKESELMEGEELGNEEELKLFELGLTEDVVWLI